MGGEPGLGRVEVDDIRIVGGGAVRAVEEAEVDQKEGPHESHRGGKGPARSAEPESECMGDA